MGAFIRAIGKIIKWMVKEFSNGKMDRNILDSIGMGKSMGRVISFSQMETIIKVFGIRGNNMGEAFYSAKRV